MNFTINNKQLIKLSIRLLIVIVVLFSANIGLSDGQIKEGPGVDTNSSIAINNSYDIKGNLDAIFENRIVVDDTDLKLGSAIYINQYWLGKPVGVYLNSSGEVQSIQLQLLNQTQTND